MVHNTCLDDLKKDVKNLNKELSELYSDVKDIVDEDGFNQNNSKEMKRRIEDIQRMIKRITQNTDTLCHYVIEEYSFVMLKFKLQEIYSGLKLIILAYKYEGYEIFNSCLEDIISMVTRVSDNISSYSVVMHSATLEPEELKLLKSYQNKLRIV